MAVKFSLGKYVPRDSVIHRLDPRVKLIVSILMMVFTLLARQPWQLAVVFVLTAVFVGLSKLRLSNVLSGLRPVLFLLLFAFFINLLSTPGIVLFSFWKITVTKEGLISGILSLIRLGLLVVSTTLFMTLTTTPIQIADAMERLLSPLRVLKFPVHEMAMMMSIALRFVPTLLEEAQKIIKAQSSRGADYDTGNALQKAKGFLSILIPLFVSSFRRADDLATAMEARCYRGGEGRTRYRAMQLRRSDVFFCIIVLLAGTTVIVLGRFIRWPI
jgi:energy-coupling factor transport system permease protein